MPEQLDMFGPGKALARPRASAPVVERSTTSEMSMTQFVQWASSALGTLSLRDVLQQAAFMLCCDVIGQDMSKAPIRLRERLANGTSRIVMPTEHPVAAFFADEPNQRHTWVEFVEMMGLWHALTQNSYAIIRRNRVGDALSLIPWQSGRVTERVNGTEIFYDVTAGTLQERAMLGAASETIPERDMIHVRGRMLDGMDGYSTLLAGKTTLETGQAIEEYRSSIFGEEGQLRGVFTRDAGMGILPEEAFQRLRTQFRALMQRFRSANEPIVLEGGLKFDSISSNPQEAELSKQFEAQIVATCRLLRIPPHKVFHLDNVKYENLETLEKAYVNDTLDPICLRHEARYGKALLSKKERARFFIQHEREALFVRDTKAETERVYKLASVGMITLDEGRARMNYNPYPNGSGDVRLVPANMKVVDQNNNVVIDAKNNGGGSSEADTGDKPDENTDDGEKHLRLAVNNE